MPHSHDHGNHGGCAHEASEIDPLEMGIQYSLYSKIDMDNMECLNEEVDGSGRFVFKPYEKRLDFDKVWTVKFVNVNARTYLRSLLRSQTSE